MPAAILLLALIAAVPETAHAVSINDLKFLGNGSIMDLVPRLIRSLFGVAGLAALLSFLYGGFLWFSDPGDGKRIAEAQSYMKNAAIGLFVMFFSYALVSFVLQIILNAQTAA